MSFLSKMAVRCNFFFFRPFIDIKANNDYMKKLLLLSALLGLLFVSCEDNSIDNTMLIGNWASVANAKAGDANAKDAALILYIDEADIEVQNGSWRYRPFTSDEYWNYYIDSDSVLHISHEEYDGDDYYTEYYELDLSFSDSYNTLTLWYDPPYSSARKYTFIRR